MKNVYKYCLVLPIIAEKLIFIVSYSMSKLAQLIGLMKDIKR